MTPELVLHYVREITVVTRQMPDFYYTTLRLITVDGEVTVTLFHDESKLPVTFGEAT